MNGSDISKRQAARRFVEYWTLRRGSEKGEDQQFWNSLLGEVLGMDDVKAHVQYQVPVPMAGTTKFLDAWIPETRVLIEHKSRGIDLAPPQSGHGGLTPYEQAAEYDNARPVRREGALDRHLQLRRVPHLRPRKTPRPATDAQTPQPPEGGLSPCVPCEPEGKGD